MALIRSPLQPPGAPVRRRLLLLLLLTSLWPVLALASGQPRLSPAVALAAQATPSASASRVIDATPPPRRVAPGGDQTLRLAGPGSGPASLDPALVRDLGTAFIVRHVFRGLTRLDGNLEPAPELADRIETSADGLTYTFRLRPGAAFHDGRPITAADVLASFTRALDPATVGGRPELVTATGSLGDIVGARELAAGASPDLPGALALDDRTVQLRLAAPRASFLAKLAGATASIVDPNDPPRAADWWRSPNGSGPFRIESWEADRSLILRRYDDFAAGAPLLQRIEIRLGPEASLPFNLYQAGLIDLTDVPAWAIQRAIDPASDLPGDLVIVPQFSTAFIAFRADQAPLDDPHIRRAIQLAFPRSNLADIGFGGRVVAADGLIPPGMLGRTWPSPLPPYDPAAARAEITASRFGTAAQVPAIAIYVGGGGSAETLRDVLAADLGLRVDVAAAEWDDFNDGLATGVFPAFELLWGADYPDPESFLWSLFGSDSPDNFTGYADPAFDALLRDAAATPDPDRRAALYDEAHRRLIASGVVLPLYHDVGYTLLGPGLRGVTITPLGLLTLDDAWLER